MERVIIGDDVYEVCTDPDMNPFGGEWQMYSAWIKKVPNVTYAGVIQLKPEEKR